MTGTACPAFRKIVFDDLEPDKVYHELARATPLEHVARGRQGGIIVDVDPDGKVPLLRSTAKFTRPAHSFCPLHREIARRIADKIADKDDDVAMAGKRLPSAKFNNALVEIYDSRYRNMGFHSDQALDMAPDSYIALFSCYGEGEKKEPPRKLVVKRKKKDAEEEDVDDEEAHVTLEDRSVVFFSDATNRRYLHKIVLDEPEEREDRERDHNKRSRKWLGVTFRLSKTRVSYDAYDTTTLPLLQHLNAPLHLANDNEARQFYAHRSRENRETTEDVYRSMYGSARYTLSPGDLLPPLVRGKEGSGDQLG